jgi:hypothetical protein
MEVGAVHKPPFPHHLFGHPHTGLSWYPDSNTIYEAGAAGLFQFRPELRLTRSWFPAPDRSLQLNRSEL